MSLSTLRAMRQQRMRPAAVAVIVGPVLGWLDEDKPDHVRIPEGCRVSQLDLRPLVALDVHVIQTTPGQQLLDEALIAIEAAGARIQGIHSGDGIVVGCNAEHEQAMKRLRRLVWPQ